MQENRTSLGTKRKQNVLLLLSYYYYCYWGGSRGGSSGSVEPPKLRSQTLNNMLFLMKSYNKWVNNYSIFWKWLAFASIKHERNLNDIEEIQYLYQIKMLHVQLELELRCLEPSGKINRLINSPHAPIIRCARSILSASLSCETEV